MKHGTRRDVLIEKPLETAWVGLKVGWDRASGYHQGGAKSENQIGGVSDMVPAYKLCGSVGGGFRKRTVASVSTSVWKKAAPHVSP